MEAHRRLSCVKKRVLELEREGQEAKESLEEAMGEGREIREGFREAFRAKEQLGQVAEDY